MTLWTIALGILVFGVLILAHEFGHFIAARSVGIGVREFSIGFGPKLLGWKRGETDYSVRALPIGGFTMMVGAEPDEPPTRDAYKSKSVAQRSWAIAAGPLMNFFLTFVLFALMFGIFGLPVEANVASTEIGQLLPGYPADKAGLQPGDVLLTVNGVPLADWNDFDKVIGDSLGREVTVTYRRGEEVRTTTMTPVADPDFPDEGMIGVTPTVIFQRVSLGRALSEGAAETWRVLVSWLTTLIGIILGRVPADLAGPVMTVRVIGSTAQSGLANLMYLAGFLSLNIGLFNLIPFPALDGGRLTFLAYEGVTGRRPDPRKENLVHFVGFAALILLMILVTYRDLLNL